MQLRRLRHSVVLALILAAGIASSRPAAAQDVRGVISGRADNGTLTVRTDNAATLTLVLTESSRVRQVDGVREARQSASVLIPGLRVQVSGAREGTNRILVDKITFNRSDMKAALAIRGGVDPTDARSLDNQARIARNAQTIAEQEKTLARQADQIAANRDNITANQGRIVATTGALATTNARIANLDDYTVVSSMTVYFRNGRAAITREHKEQLQQLAAQAKNVQGYMIQVQGYASAVGSDALNQRLSAQRADAVTAALQQSGVPPTNIVVPAAMGISEQVATNDTAKGQAENRRTVVTLLQSKGIGER